MTSPTPERSAAPAHMAAAPAMPAEPATISRCPFRFLWALRGFGGSARRASAGSISAARPSGRNSGGMPMSAASISPHTSSPSPRRSPVFSSWNVTVMSARTQGERAAPLSPFSPEGMSTATTAAPRPRSRFIRSISAAAPPSGARDRPVPYSASTHTSGASGAPSGQSSGMPAARASARFFTASGDAGGAAGNSAQRPPAQAYIRAQA